MQHCAITDKVTLHECLSIECKFYPRSKWLGIIRFFFPITESDILLKHIVLLRKTEYYKNMNKKLMAIIYKTRLRILQNKYGIHIPLNCCDMGLHIMHTGPILINERVAIGKNCAIHINTSIVAGGANDDVPTIGDGVVIGVGAVLLGGIRIADNVAIGANAVVTKSIDLENVSVAGVPAKIVGSNGRLKWKEIIQR